MGTHPIFESDFDCLTERMGNILGWDNSIVHYNGPVHYAGQIQRKLRGKTRAQEVEVLEQAARDLNATVIKINAGLIIDGLIIAQPGKPALHGGGQGGDQIEIIALDSDEFIHYLSGTNDFFDGPQVTNNVTIITNKRRFGPFGKYRGYPEHGYPFELNMGDLRLANDRRNKYLGPIEDPKWRTENGEWKGPVLSNDYPSDSDG